jgi:hypothetical protein
MLFLLRHFSTYAGGSGCEERLWRGLRQSPTWGCVRLRETGTKLDSSNEATRRERMLVILVPRSLPTRPTASVQGRWS